MTIEASIFTAIKSLCSNRVYPDVAPYGTTLPYITYTQVGGEPMSYLERTVPSIQNGRFQFNVWGTSRAACSALMAQIETALVTATAFQATPLGAPTSIYDSDMALYGAMQDFSVWSTR